jgi:catechol 2,3-dioxygenase-like lactoylglutathione lyase family enzyme
MTANPPSLRSIFVVCRDKERSADFYGRLGFSIKESKERSHVMQAGGQLELHLHSELTPEEESRYGVTLSEGSAGLVQSYDVVDLDQVSQSVPSKFVLSPPHVTPWGARILMLKDPDGHRLEIRERSVR